MDIWYILWTFGIFFPFLVCCTKKNLATLFGTGCKKRNRFAPQPKLSALFVILKD
jgi:hypothetical protein